MQLIKVENRDYKGEYQVFERDKDQDLPVINGDYLNLKVGDWTEDKNGLIAQALKVHDSQPSLRVRGRLVTHSITLTNCFGVFPIARYTSRELPNYKKIHSSSFTVPDFNRPLFSNKRNSESNKLSEREKMFLVLAFSFGFEKAYKDIYFKHYSHIGVDTKLRKILRKSDAKEWIMSTIAEEMQKRGMDKPAWYLAKIDQTLADGVDTPTKLVLFKNLASFSNQPDIINLINPEQSNQLPGGGYIPLSEGKKIEEAKFEEVKEGEKLKV